MFNKTLVPQLLRNFFYISALLCFFFVYSTSHNDCDRATGNFYLNAVAKNKWLSLSKAYYDSTYILFKNEYICVKFMLVLTGKH